nr:uncharacterized protein LOC109428688 [Aedes albopictus]
MVKLILVVALVGFVAADVSEILRRSHGRFAVQSIHYGGHPRSNNLNPTESEDPHQFETIFYVEDPVTHDVPAFDVVESDEPAAVPFQLQQSHADYQGPYHYEKPKLDNGYLAPIITTHRPNDEYPGLAPIITTHRPNDVYPGLAPIITTHRPNDEYPGLAPIITTHKPNGDYLPPFGPRDFEDVVAKRSIRLRG